jgi:hypothetical protein
MNQQLEKVISSVFKTYRGVNLERKEGYWICLGVSCPTLKDCDIVINTANSIIVNSLNKNKKNEYEKEVNSEGQRAEA